MDKTIIELAEKLREKMIARRRDFHKYPEAGWTEFRTASIVADNLTDLGYDVLVGDEVIDIYTMMGVPPQEELIMHSERALAQGANPKWVEKMQGGKTGVVGIMKFSKPGPTVAFRFDMDANDVDEAKDDEHRPYREGFASVNKGAHHGCGHDGHTSIGLAIAEILVNMKDDLAGTIKLIFQPAEEGLRGGKAVVSRGIVDDVNYMLGFHLGGVNVNRTGQIACKVEGWLASTKFDAVFTGVPAHSGGDPELGKNAVLAAASAVLNIHAISRHSQGPTRVNVGIIQGGTGRNVVPANAVIKVETRGATTEVDKYVYDQAVSIVKGAAAMYNIDVKITEEGGAAGCVIDEPLVERLQPVAERLGMFEVIPVGIVSGSEDYTHYMERVQKNGGQAGVIRIGTETTAGQHHPRFDFNEEAMVLGTLYLTAAAVELLLEKNK